MNICKAALLMLIATGLGACQNFDAGRSSISSTEMKKVLARLKRTDGPYVYLDLSALPKATGKEWRTPGSEKEEQSLLHQPGMEVGNYDPDGSQEDAFLYYVFYKPATRQYWVWKTGGIGMISGFYGPGKLPLENSPPYSLHDVPGFILSPYAENAGYVDVRSIEAGARVRCPYTGRIFIVPKSKTGVGIPLRD